MIHVTNREVFIELNANRKCGVLALESLIVKVEDEGAGPYLVLTCRNLDPSVECDANSVSIHSAEDIDTIALVLKHILRDAGE